MQGIHMLNDRRAQPRNKRWEPPQPRSVDIALIVFVVVVLALAWRFDLAGSSGASSLGATYTEVLKTHVTPAQDRKNPAG